MNENEFVEGGLEEMEKVLKHAEVGRIAFSDGFSPYIVPLNFVYHEGKIAFHCAWKGKKLEMIKKNPNCCLEVDEFRGEVSYDYDSLCHLDYDSVLAFGKARIENGVEEKLRFFQLLHAKYKEIYRKPLSEGGIRFEKKNLSEACCVILDVEELTGRYERTVEGERIKKMWLHTF